MNPKRVDAAIAVALFAGLTAETLTSSHLHGPVALNVLTCAGASLPFAWRRSHPIPVVAVVLTSAALEAAFLSDFTSLTTSLVVPLLTAYTIGSEIEGRRESWLVLGAAYVGGMAIEALDHGLHANEAFLVAFYLLVAWYIGRSLRVRNQLNDALREKAERLDAEREERARAEVTAERARIARELHDVVAHGVSVMVVQAGGARRQLRMHPDRAREALAAVETSGRQALEEMRRLVGVMNPAAAPERAPAPGLNRLDELVGRARDAGLPVAVHVDGEPERLTAGIDLAAYRVIQEALTNTIKHAGAAQADVTIRYQPEAVELEVADDGRGGGIALPGGHGLVGMRERVAMYGGELETGAREGGGYAVRARLPR